MKITEENFVFHCIKNYDNVHLVTLEEFEEDLQRFSYLAKLFTRYKDSGEIRERLVLNHLIVLYNLFGNSATELLYFKLGEEKREILNTYLVYMNRVDDSVEFIPEIMEKLLEL